MPIIVSCSCGKKYQTADDAAGKQIRCANCQSILLIPNPVVAKPISAGPNQAVRNQPPASSPFDFQPPPSAYNPFGPGAPIPASHQPQPSQPGRRAVKNRSGSASDTSWGLYVLLGVAATGVLILAIVGIMVFTSKSKSAVASSGSSSASLPTTAPETSVNPRSSSSASTPNDPGSFKRPGAAPRPDFSKTLAGGVKYGQTKGAGGGPASQTEMNVYLPTGDHQPKSLGCVLVAPAGTNLLVGASVAEGDYHDETLPYAQAGFAVVQYSLDGDIDLQNATPQTLKRAYEEFRLSLGGQLNADQARMFVRETLPEVDPARIYLAGHSSAGTVALNSSNGFGVAGCVVYAPCTDPVAFHRDFGSDPQVRRMLPGYESFDRTNSPVEKASTIGKPIFLFHARDDSVVSVAESRKFVELLRKHNKDVEYLEVASGDHYDSMIQQGIPAGIAWLKKLDRKKSGR
jgi:fermentation-respiration switch protein FrsA (DUF1100 family)/DNA-directed RNA polymerase subunit RPC12/RpoP